MSPRTLVSRLAWLQFTMAAVLISSFAASAIWLTSRALEHQESEFLSISAAHLRSRLETEWRDERDLRRAAAAVVEEDAPAGVWVDVLDEAGRAIASSAPSGRPDPRHGTRELRLHLERGAWLVASVSTRGRHDTIAALRRAFAFTALPLIALVAMASRALARRTLQPFSRITAQAERASVSGDTQPLGMASDPAEVAILTGAFNRLLARLDEMLRVERSFTQDAAHELRTPLTVLSGELEFALTDASLPPRQRDGLRKAGEQVRAMIELVEALLLLRRVDRGLIERESVVPVNLSDLVRDVARELGERKPERAADMRVDAEDEVLVPGHAALLASALRNLISNAIKFSVAGQPVRVSVTTQSDHGVVLVEDGGPGIPAGDLERVFDPFFRGPEARASHEGHGLGLPILRRVARAHGGDVTAAASMLGGARFELRLPSWAARA